MNRLIKFLKLPCKQQRLLAEAFLYLGVSRFFIRFFPFKKTAGILGQQNRETVLSNEGIDSKTVRQVSGAVRTMSRYTPWESKCLAQAYAGKIMLKKRKQRCTVYLGVLKDENNEMKAHAWLRCGTIYVTGGNGHESFTVTGRFA